MLLTALVVTLLAFVLGMILIAVFAWGEWNSNPYPEEKADDYQGF